MSLWNHVHFCSFFLQISEAKMLKYREPNGLQYVSIGASFQPRYFHVDRYVPKFYLIYGNNSNTKEF